MLDRLINIDLDEEKLKLISRLKYVVLLLPIIPIYAIISYYVVTYSDVEDDVVKLAKQYVSDYSINIPEGEEYYVPLGQLGEIDGAELCSNASGVIVTNKGNKYKYKTYLNCTDYETKLVSNSEKYIILTGNPVVLLNSGEIYEEKGYYSDDIVDVVVDGKVGKSPGVYTLSYHVVIDGNEKQVLTRKVIVTEFDKNTTNSGVINSEEPTLKLFGDTIMVLEKGEKYVEPGYKAVDYKDGKISRKVKRTDDVNVKKMTKSTGTYELVYSVTNTKNKTVTKKRTVKVVDKKSDIVIESAIKKQTQGFAITLKISGSEYTHTILPNGVKDEQPSITYKVTKNDTYRFAIYDIYNNVYVRDIDVNDVDITPPKGTCIASTSSSGTNVYVSASDKSGVKSYNFIIDGNLISSIEAPSYRYGRSAKAVKAQVFDTYGNNTTIVCQVIEINGRGSTTNGIMNIPLILQTNYTKPIKWYGGTTTVKGYGCGPTSVSMIVSYLTGNISQNPQIIFEDLVKQGYFHGHGFGKAALTKAAAKYGVTCEWQSLTEASLKQTLKNGYPIIAFVGKNAFGIYTGHYIVLKGVTSDGKIALNDPYSEKVSKKTWDANNDIIKKTRDTKSFAVCY